MNNLELINQYIDIIKNSNLPVEDLTSININGEFSIELPQSSDDYYNYVGKVIGNGVIAIRNIKCSYPHDMDIFDTTIHHDLIAYNIEGYNFTACTEKKFWLEDSINNEKANVLKIQSLYLNYNDIIEALKNGLTDEFIKEEFRLNFFNSSIANSKTRLK